jgi:hypothetical protein
MSCPFCLAAVTACGTLLLQMARVESVYGPSSSESMNSPHIRMKSVDIEKASDKTVWYVNSSLSAHRTESSSCASGRRSVWIEISSLVKLSLPRMP